jgi:nicotinamidase-related amidase
VLSAVRWAADIDYRLIVIADCCADRDDEVQQVLTEKVFPRQAAVITSQEFIQALG